MPLRNALVSLVLILFPASNSSAQITATVGPIETVITPAQVVSNGLDFFPDEKLRAFRMADSSYVFFSANGGANGCGGAVPGKPVRSAGTLQNPLQSNVARCLPTSGISEPHYYEGFGNAYIDPATGAFLRFYHIESWYNQPGIPYMRLLIAKSVDGGYTWTSLGEIITANLSYNAANSMNPTPEVALGSGSFLIVGDYFYCYFGDVLASDPYRQQRLSVARAKISDVVNAALNQNVAAPWTKYYQGGWTQPGIGGLSDMILQSWSDNVSYNKYLNKFILAAPASGGQAIGIQTSDDGLNWSAPQAIGILATGNIAAYLSIIGLEDNPSLINSQQFYAYYLYAPPGSTGYDDRNNPTVRQLITITSPGASTAPPSTAGTTPPAAPRGLKIL